MTNIAFTHKFTDLRAKADATRSNISHMMYLFWHANAPQEMRESVVHQEVAQEAIDDWLDDHLSPTIYQISDFLSQLVTDSHAIAKDNR